MKKLPILLVVLSLLLAGCQSSDPRIAQTIKKITDQSVRKHVESLAAIGPRYAYDEEPTNRTIAYIRGQLIAYGYDPKEEIFLVNEAKMKNIVVERAGSVNPERIVELGAHYDTVEDCPGADDNATGVAGVLETARLLARIQTENTVRLCFFAGEEENFLGSRAHVELIKQLGEDVEGILILEMIGFSTSKPNSQYTPVRIPLILSPPRTGDFILILGNFSSGGIGGRYASSIDHYVSDLDYFSLSRIGGFLKDAARSDHYPYWQAGMKGIMITDTANFRNPNYHKQSDTPATIDFGFLKAVTQAAAATILHWGGMNSSEDPGI